MSAFEALDAARAAGIEVQLDGDDLVLESAAEPPVAIVDLLTEHKSGILAILRSGQAAAEERVAIAEVEFRADPIGAAPLLASTDATGTGSSDITGSVSTGMIGSASGAITGSHSDGITGSTDNTALLQPAQPWDRRTGWPSTTSRSGIAEYDHGLSRPGGREARRRALHRPSGCTNIRTLRIRRRMPHLWRHRSTERSTAGHRAHRRAVWLHMDARRLGALRRIAEADRGLGRDGDQHPGGSSP